MILIAGTGRSGTTWLGKILDSSPHLFYKAQPDDVTRYPWFRDIPSRLDPTPEFDRFREPFRNAVRRTFWAHSPYLNDRPDFAKSFLRNGAWSAFATAMRAWRKIGRGRVPIITIPRTMVRDEPERVPLVIKSVVSNLRLAWIHRHFPAIKIILIIRHPGGYLSSIFRGAREHAWTGVGKSERLAPTILPFPRPEHSRYADAFEGGSDFERELIYWIVANETPYLALRGSGVLKTVVYEDLCLRPHEIISDTFAFLGCPVTEQTTRFVDESTRTERNEYYSVYKNPVHSAFKWRTELKDDRIEVIKKYLASCWALRGFWGDMASPRPNT